MSSMHPRSSLEWEFLNHVQVPTLLFFYFFMFDVTVDATPSRFSSWIRNHVRLESAAESARGMCHPIFHGLRNYLWA